MFAIRFFAVAALVAAVPCASAAEPSSLSLTRLSLNAPRHQPVSLGFATPDRLVATGSGITGASEFESLAWRVQNPPRAGLAAAQPPAGSAEIAIALNLLTPQPPGFEAAAPLASSSLATRPQTLAPLMTIQPDATWLAPGTASALFTKPTLYGGALAR